MTSPSLVHEDPEFGALLSIVSAQQRVSDALVEKDYWVTHTLWALQEADLRVSFKGGTSLSKGFGLIERFSEDLDVKLEASDLPPVRNWTSEGKKATEQREHFFRALGERLVVPGAEVTELPELRDRAWRNVVFGVRYPSRAADHLPEGLRPFVQVEVGSARVTPGEDRPISSWVHDHLRGEGLGLGSKFRDNRSEVVHCVSPSVTLLEKLDAVSRRFARDPFEPASFVRHYEDIARIVGAGGLAEPIALRVLLTEMMEAKDIRHWPGADDPAWNPDADPERWRSLEEAWEAIKGMFWGERIPMVECAGAIRGLLAGLPV